MDETLATRDRHDDRDTIEAMSTEDVEYFSAYLKSMPAEYKAAFDIESARAHEAIVRRRGPRRVHVEIWRELSERVVAICVVADDKPGLLSCISAALVECEIDVVSAHAYTRRPDDGHNEAVDLLWIRHLRNAKGQIPPIRSRDIITVAEAIEKSIAGGVSDEVVPSSRSFAPPSVEEGPLSRGTRVKFETNAKTGATTLTVEAVDRPGLLLAVTQALFRANVQIVGLRATTEKGCAVDRFSLAEADGTPLRRDRLLTLQTGILGALDEQVAALRTTG
jgi:[protein-PII] uridylyltransferase